MVEVYSVSSLPLFIMGVIALTVSLGPVNWCIYGRATLGYLGVFLIFAAAIRSAVGLDVISVDTAIRVNATFAVVFMVIILNLVSVHVYIHWSNIVDLVRKGTHARH